MTIDRERERREGEAREIERKIERANLEKSKVSDGVLIPGKEGREDGDFEREREKKVMQGKLKFLAYELFLSNQGK